MSLEDLARLDCRALADLYAVGSVPASLAALDGAPVGRMLAVRALDRGPVARLLRGIAGSRHFVWAGKSFEAAGPTSGHGVNRVRAPGLLGLQKLFPFETRFGASALDGAPTVVLDYDLADNPPYIRRVHDEIREVSPGLFLGPAMWKAQGSPRHTVLWFALDTARP
ncbi:MAG: hypothetical protein IT373_32375 [Polyangiaceae bacterium]|nr:hypothetical protein [Polyangiaceae bacterium]